MKTAIIEVRANVLNFEEAETLTELIENYLDNKTRYATSVTLERVE